MSFAEKRCKYLEEKLKEELQEKLKSKSFPKNLEILLESVFSKKLNNVSLVSRLMQFLKKVQIKNREKFIKSAEFIERIKDLADSDYNQKKASIDWFGEQKDTEILFNDSELLGVLQEFGECENDNILRLTTKRAISKLKSNLFYRQPNFTEEELTGDFQLDRRPYRTMLRITRINGDYLWVVLPGWNPKEEVKINKRAFPSKLYNWLKPNERLFARINKGADTQSELYFTDFEEKT